MIRGVRAAAETRDWALDLRHPDKPLGDLGGAVGLIAESPSLALRSLRARLPAVGLLGTAGTPRRPEVRLDDEAIGRQAARHLLERGHRRCACLAEGRNDRWLRLRNEGFRRELAIAGVLVEVLDAAGLAQQLAIQPGPLGVFAGNDGHARGICETCLRAGIAVPAQVAVVGADDDDLFCALSRPALSSVRIPFHRVGEEAGALLARLIDGRAGPAQVAVSPTGVVERASTALCLDDDEVLAKAHAVMGQRACQGLGPAGAARAAGVSRRTLERRWKTRFGGTLGRHLASTRLTEAERLILSTRLPMAEIARRCGYPGITQLSRAVRLARGLPPTRLRGLR